MNYRPLTENEILTLQAHGCYAEDWTSVSVAEDFTPDFIINTRFYGEVNIGVFQKSIEVEEGFWRHSGINNATLRNVTIGDNCVIENIGYYISNYDIGDECCICNVGKLSSTGDATYGQGNVISVLNEGGDGNIIIFDGLTSQMAAYMMMISGKEEFSTLKKLIDSYGETQRPQRACVGYRVKILNTTEICNTIISDECEICGATRLNECSISGSVEASVYIGHDVICENTIIGAGSSILDGAKVDNSFVGEACHIGKGFSAEASVFFANSYMDNGEACAALCGPFTVSHHKSSLLIGGQYSFYNAGSNTNFSNHAYKIGPIHWGIMERGCKTASGCHLLWPATIGTFTMCMGKIQNHPDTKILPFSYLFGDGTTSTIVPGRNLVTVGTYRDINKWPKRDVRPHGGRQSIVNFDWLNPMVVAECIEGKKTLLALRQEQGENNAYYTYNGCNIKNRNLAKGIEYYDMAIKLFIGNMLSQHGDDLPTSSIGTGEWLDLCGLPAPQSEIDILTSDLGDCAMADIREVSERLMNIHKHYDDYKWNFAYRVIIDTYQLDTLTADDISNIREDCDKAHEDWLNAIRHDAENEYAMGDVEDTTLQKFLSSIK